MKKARKKRVRRKPWLKRDVDALRKMAREKTPARVIARTLGRTEGAVRQKGYAAGISLNTRGRRSKAKRRK